jgi:hypothetical protein
MLAISLAVPACVAESGEDLEQQQVQDLTRGGNGYWEESSEPDALVLTWIQCADGESACTVSNDPCYGTFTYCATADQCNNAQWLAVHCDCGEHWYENCFD